MEPFTLKSTAAAVLLCGLAACSAPSNPEADKMLADHKAMLKADSTAKANETVCMDCFKKVYTMFETGNSTGLEECVAETMVEHTPAPGVTTTGLQGLKDVIAMQHVAFPDMKMTVLSSAVVGDMGYVHFNQKGTNSGAMGPNMPATNKAIDINGVDIVRFENGKAVEHWGYWEDGKMMQQLGLAPAPGAAPEKK
jgi:predicted SnoaL-like aldol condensation-catalyzing enzyme